MSERSDLEFLCDIKEAINRIKSYTKELEYKEFLKDKKPRMQLFATLRLSVKPQKIFQEI